MTISLFARRENSAFRLNQRKKKRMFNWLSSLLFPKPLTPEEMANIEQLVEDIIKNNKVAVFSKSYCREFFFFWLLDWQTRFTH